MTLYNEVSRPSEDGYWLNGVHIDSHAQEVYDVTGAGDTVTAVFAACLTLGVRPRLAAEAANYAAAQVVSQIGCAVPDKGNILQYVKGLSNDDPLKATRDSEAGGVVSAETPEAADHG